MKVECSAAYVDLESEDGVLVESVQVQCVRCGYCESSYGTHGASVKRSLALLNENCPKDEDNFYAVDE